MCGVTVTLAPEQLKTLKTTLVMSHSELLILFASPFIGSFLGCLADRLPEGRPLVAARSSCDSCGHALQPFDMMPVVSWLMLRARCRYCRHKISPYYPAVELVTFAVSLSAILATIGPIAWISIALGWVLVALAAMDLRHMVLSDSLTIGLILCGLASARFWSQFTFADHLLGALIGGAVLYCISLIYRLLRHQDGLGMGDVKLFAAAGAWLAWQNLPSVLLYATFSALAAVLAHRLIVAPSVRGPIPLGAFICLGFWLTWLYGPINMLGT